MQNIMPSEASSSNESQQRSSIAKRAGHGAGYVAGAINNVRSTVTTAVKDVAVAGSAEVYDRIGDKNRERVDKGLETGKVIATKGVEMGIEVGKGRTTP